MFDQLFQSWFARTPAPSASEVLCGPGDAERIAAETFMQQRQQRVSDDPCHARDAGTYTLDDNYYQPPAVIVVHEQAAPAETLKSILAEAERTKVLTGAQREAAEGLARALQAAGMSQPAVAGPLAVAITAAVASGRHSFRTTPSGLSPEMVKVFEEVVQLVSTS